MDVAKLLAVLLAGQQPLADMYGVGKVSGQRLPLVQMPTTAGTGSGSDGGIHRDDRKPPRWAWSRRSCADLAILDAELTLGLPGAATYTGIDAMVHAIEAYTSAHLKNPVSDMLAIKALELLSRHILTACRDGGAARVLLGAMFAGQAFANSPVAACMRWHIPSAAFSMFRMGCRTRWCWRPC